MASGLTSLKRFLMSGTETSGDVGFILNRCLICNQEWTWICDTCTQEGFENRTVDKILNNLSEGVRFAHVNLCSIFNKLSHIQILLRNGIFDVLAVSESKLDSSICDVDIQVKGYTVLRRDRNRKGGGVLMYINDKWTVTKQDSDKDLEFLSVEIQLRKSHKIIVAVVYRPPDAKATWKEGFMKKVDNLSTTKSELVIMGDFNIHSTCQDPLKPSMFVKQMEKKGFTMVIKEDTRVGRSTNPSIIDHIYVRYTQEVISSGVIPLGVSDHHMVYLIKNGIGGEDQPDRVYVKLRDENILNESAFITDLRRVNWDSLKSQSNINSMAKAFYSSFMEVVDRYMPIKEQLFCSDAEKWVDDDVLKEMEQRDILHQRALRTKCEYDWMLYNNAKKRVVAKINKAKREFVIKALSKSYTNSKDAWILLKRSLPTDSAKPTCIKTSKDTFSDSKDIANAFNQFFSKKRLAERLEMSELMQTGSFIIPYITIDFVKEKIRALSDSMSTGIDGVSVKMLKISLDVIAPTLELLLNKSIESGEVPSEWKKTIVGTLFKDGDTRLIENYRRIESVLPVISNVLEGHVFDTFCSYLCDNNLLKIHPVGHTTGHTKETALHYLVNNLLENRNSMKLTGAVFPAVCAPLNNVDHQILLQKLSSIGISENSYKWFESYLTGRTQCVRWKGVYSDEKIVTTGVPNGSKLGILLFTLYINDYPDCLEHAKVTMYNGDIALFISHASVNHIERELHEDLSNSMKWMKKNKLTVDLKKTKSMLIGYEKTLWSQQLRLRIENNDIETVDEIMFLGVKIDRQLTWSSHIKYLLEKITPELNILKQLQKFLSKETLLKIYKTVIFSNIVHCCTIWCSPKDKAFIEKLSKEQRNAVCIISNEKFSNISFRGLNLMPVEDFFKFKKLVLLFKILYNVSPAYKYLNDFQCEDQISTRETRNSSDCKLQVPVARTEYYKQSFKISSASLWNSLPESVTECTSLLTFETECRKYFNGNYR